jgi:hypothetical protein
MWCSTALPTRMGGLDQMASNDRSSGTSSGRHACTGSRPSEDAVVRSRSRARSLTSTPQTCDSGERSARVRAIGPQPQPRSSRVPLAGGAGASRSRTAVPLSTPSGLKMPAAVFTVTRRPASSTVTARRWAALTGAAVK